nr:hypothetical protein [Tanacetum cinerariifolium]
MDLFNLIGAPNPTKVKTGTRPRTAHKVPLLTAIASRVIDMGDTAVATGSLGTPTAVEKSPLDLSDEDPPPVITERGDEAIAKVILESGLGKEVAAMGLGKSLAAMGIEEDSTSFVLATQKTLVNAKSVSNLEPLLYAKPQTILEQDIAKKTPLSKDLDYKKSTSFTSMVGSPGIPPGYFLELRHLPNDNFLSQYNINLARQVEIGSQLRLRFEQEAKLLKKAVAQVARRDQRIKFSNLQVSNNQVSQEVSTLQAQITGEERIKASFEEFKKYESSMGYRARSTLSCHEVC